MFYICVFSNSWFVFFLLGLTFIFVYFLWFAIWFARCTNMCVFVMFSFCLFATWQRWFMQKLEKDKNEWNRLSPQVNFLLSLSFLLFYSLSHSHTLYLRVQTLVLSHVVTWIAPLILNFFSILIYHVTVVSKWNVFTATH